MDNNGKFDLQCYFMYRYDRKKTEIYKKMKASYITLTENCIICPYEVGNGFYKKIQPKKQTENFRQNFGAKLEHPFQTTFKIQRIFDTRIFFTESYKKNI